jgi:hypothetical protein
MRYLREKEETKMKYRIRSIQWPKVIIKDGFISVKAAASWVEDNAYLGGMWAGGWTIEAY